MCDLLISSPAPHVLFGTFSDLFSSHFSVTFSLTFSSFLSSFSLRYMDSEGRVRPLTAAVKAELLTVIDNMAKVSQLSVCCVQDLYVLVTIFFLLIVGSTAHVSLCLFVQLSYFYCPIILFSISSSCSLSHYLILFLHLINPHHNLLISPLPHSLLLHLPHSLLLLLRLQLILLFHLLPL